MNKFSVIGGLFLTACLATTSVAGTNISPVCSRLSKPVGLPAGTPPKLALVDADATTPVGQAALRLAFNIENGLPDPWIGVTGNFDGMGMSLGIVQFNFGGSVQDTFADIPKAVFARTMPTWSKTFYQAVHSQQAAAIALATTMQTSRKVGRRTIWDVDNVALKELRSFLGSPEVRAAQNKAAASIYQKGYSRAMQWAKARGASKPTPREIATFVDNQVFSGGALGGIWVEQAAAFRASFPNDGEMVHFVTRWLASCPYKGEKFLYGGPDAETDVKAWQSAVPKGTKLSDDKALLFAFGFVRALTANGPPQIEGQVEQHGVFKAQVIERRGLIALGAGTANGVKWPAGILDGL